VTVILTALSRRLAIVLQAHALASYAVFATFTLFDIARGHLSLWGIFFLIPAPVTMPVGTIVMALRQPLYSLAGLLLYLPIFIFADATIRRREILRTRRHFNLCLACGYDLCATPDRCPECGIVPPKILA
jgi:hypothetical protein